MAKPYRRNSSGPYVIALFIDGKQRVRSLRTTDAKEAKAIADRINARLAEFKRRNLPRPASCQDAESFADYLVNGTAEKKSAAQANAPFDKLANSWLVQQKNRHPLPSHFAKLIEFFGDQNTETIGLENLQAYANRRAKEGVVGATIKRELDSLRTMWRRFHKSKVLVQPYPLTTLADIDLPEPEYQHPYRTFSEAMESANGTTKKDDHAYWHSVYLSPTELQEFLAVAKDKCERLTIRDPSFSFLFPAILAAGTTGMRRIEIGRSRRIDWNMKSGRLTVRDRKLKKTGGIENRTAPISKALAAVMKEYLGSHDSPAAFFSAGCMEEGKDGIAIDRNKFQEGFRAAVHKTPYANLSGWHTLRHSFISALTNAGCSDREIDLIVGHRTDEQRRRYSHVSVEDKSMIDRALGFSS